MLFAHLLVSLGSAIVASSLTLTGSIPPGFDSDGHFGAQTPPWAKGCHPGWYYGENPGSYPDVFCLTPDTCHKIHSKSLGFHCPPNPYPSSEDGYYQTFSNLKAATEASDYLTYGLVESVEACLAMCDCVEGCSFVNTYHDVNGKNGSPLLTCALFKYCHDSSDAINCGGQTQPDGSLDYITDSYGWCKV